MKKSCANCVFVFLGKEQKDPNFQIDEIQTKCAEYYSIFDPLKAFECFSYGKVLISVVEKSESAIQLIPLEANGR